MKILVSVKHLPDFRGIRRFNDEHLVDREAASGILNEADEHSIEQAVRLRQRFGGEIIALCMGSPSASRALEKVLQLGADQAFLVTDPALRGSDALATSAALAAAVRTIEAATGGPFDLIFTALTSTDSYMAVQPAMLAERLGMPALSYVTTLEVDPGSGTAQITRTMDDRLDTLEAQLPVVVSITDQTPQGRTPNMKDILAARAKTTTVLSLAEIGLSPDAVGVAAARAVVGATRTRPAKEQGTILIDDGAGSTAEALADFLISRIPR